MKRTSVVIGGALAGLAAIAGLLVVIPLVGRTSPDTPPERAPLVTGKFITPQGTQTEVGSFPVNMAATPDGKYVVVTNSGFRQLLSVLRADDGAIASQIEVGEARSPKKEGLYYGLAIGAAPSRGGWNVYASRGAEDRVAVYFLSPDGKLTDTGRYLNDQAPETNGTLKHHVAGIALSAAGDKLYAVNNQTGRETDMKGSLSILDTAENRMIGKAELPGFPFAVVVRESGNRPTHRPIPPKVYVTSERDGVVTMVAPNAGIDKNITVGDHPIGLTLNAAHTLLFVANSGSDTVSIIDTERDTVVRTIPLRPADIRGLPGCTPTGLSLSSDEKQLYVTLADMNAVAVIDLPSARVTGYIPVGWYPTSVIATQDGKRLFVANAKGVTARNQNGKEIGTRGRYIQNIIEGTVSVVQIPSGDELKRLTTQTLTNNRVTAMTRKAEEVLANPGIEHVIYIIKENRTYDQILGDLPQGNGDRSLCLFPREVTPNQHALAERFVLLDNFYDCAEVSADGWNWSTSGMANEYVARNAPYNYSQRGRVYDFEGQNNGVPVDLVNVPDVARAPGGYIWDGVVKKGLSLRNYGFFVSFNDLATRQKEPGKTGANDNEPNKKALVGRTDTNFRGFDGAYPDSDLYTAHGVTYPRRKPTFGEHKSTSRFEEWKREFDDYVKKGEMPAFSMIRFGCDHTNGTSAGYPSPRAMVADNDYAVGQLVEAVSKSPFWKSTAIFILEDDAQNGFDHVDAHRSVAFVISPYIRKSTIDHRFYNTDSVLRTMELLLGLPPMNQYDALASPIAVFGNAPDNDAPYTALLPDKKIASEVNGRSGYRSRDSERQNFADADSVPDEVLNDILWHALKGRNTPKPAIRYGLKLNASHAVHPSRDADD